MRAGSEIIYEQLQTASMCLRGLYSYLCEEGGIDGPTPELEQKIDAIKNADEHILKAITELRKITPQGE